MSSRAERTNRTTRKKQEGQTDGDASVNNPLRNWIRPPLEDGSVNSLGAIPNGRLHNRRRGVKVVASKSRAESLLAEFVDN